MDASSKVHRLPLQAHISQLLKRATERDDLPQDQVEEIAREIATDRATLESRMRFARELIANAPPPTTKGVKPESFDERIFLSQLRKGVSYDQEGHPLKLNNAHLCDLYTDGVDERVAADLASGLGEPTGEERLVARMALMRDATDEEKTIAQGLNLALRWGRTMDAEALRKERKGLPRELVEMKQKELKWPEAIDLLSRLYRSFTCREIAALADPERDLPATIEGVDAQARGVIAKAIETATARAHQSYQLAYFPWNKHALQYGLSDSYKQSMHRGQGMSLL